MIWKLGAALLGQVIGLFGERGKAAQDLLATRVGAMQRSMTDEFAILTVLSPYWVAWFSEPAAQRWLAFMDGVPGWYTDLTVGIILATFGIGKLARVARG